MQYLDVLGIDMFVPRWVLPAARSSLQAALPTALSDHETAVAGHPSATASTRISQDPVGIERSSSPQASTNRSVENIIGDLSDKTRVTDLADRTQNPIAAKVQAEVEESVAFSLSIWRVPERCWILDARAVGEALPTQALLSNILTAKQWRLADGKPEILNWPMFSGHGYSGGWDAAGEMVKAFMQARLTQFPVENVLLMGRDAFVSFNGNPDKFTDMVGQSLQLDDLGVCAIVLPSLADMLKKPALKRAVWNAIRDLS